jgi:hypothetical protein
MEMMVIALATERNANQKNNVQGIPITLSVSERKEAV